jgi:hypothetical protein
VPKRPIATELATGELKELSLEAYPFAEWSIGLDLIWSVEATPGAIATWLKAELPRTKVMAESAGKRGQRRPSQSPSLTPGSIRPS